MIVSGEAYRKKQQPAQGQGYARDAGVIAQWAWYGITTGLADIPVKWICISILSSQEYFKINLLVFFNSSNKIVFFPTERKVLPFQNLLEINH